MCSVTSLFCKKLLTIRVIQGSALHYPHYYALRHDRFHRSRGLLKVPFKRWNLLQSLTNIYCAFLENSLKGKVPLSTRFWLDSLVVYDSFEYFRINKNLEKDMTVKICRSTMNFLGLLLTSRAF